MGFERVLEYHSSLQELLQIQVAIHSMGCCQSKDATDGGKKKGQGDAAVKKPETEANAIEKEASEAIEHSDLDGDEPSEHTDPSEHSEHSEPSEHSESEHSSYQSSDDSGEYPHPTAKVEKTEVEQLKALLLEAHNQKRALHNVPKLVWSLPLSKMAQKWAEQLARTNKFEHSPKEHRGEAGENMAAHTTWDAKSGDVVTNMWYDEIKLYDFYKPGFTGETGHFTQVVWQDSKEIGLGVAYCKGMKMWIYVANYHPAGNVMGKFERNVTRPMKS